MLRIGAHVSIEGGLHKAIERARGIGAECVQLFASSPRSWRPARHDPEEVRRFRGEADSAQLEPIYLHTIYLLNLASGSPLLWRRSIESLTDCLVWGHRLGAAGVVTHLGSSTGSTREEALERLCLSLHEALEAGPGSEPILLEISAGMGNAMGSSFAELGAILKMMSFDGRLQMCLDTAHAFAAGYDLTNRSGLDQMVADIEEHLGLDRLKLVHANDSKTPLGSGVDRHENIGRGMIGEKGFTNLLRHPALRSLPFVLEVPGLDGRGPDAANISALRRLCQ